MKVLNVKIKFFVIELAYYLFVAIFLLRKACTVYMFLFRKTVLTTEMHINISLIGKNNNVTTQNLTKWTYL